MGSERIAGDAPGGGRRDYTGIVRLLGASGGDVVTLGFKEIEAALGFSLPASARRHPAWWSNTESHAASKVWMSAGWRSFNLSLQGEEVSFRKVASAGRRPDKQRHPAAGSSSTAETIVVRTPHDARAPEERGGRIGLVGCVKKKLAVAAPAADLYISPLFRGRRSYVEHSCERWFVLSALHGLVRPDEVLEPYDFTLNDATSDERRAWADRVLRQIDVELGSCQGLTFEIHAGAKYVDYGLGAGLRARGARVEQPAAGLALGEQLAFYTHACGSAPQPQASRPSEAETYRDRPAGVGQQVAATPAKSRDDAAYAVSRLGDARQVVRLCDWPRDLAGLDSPGLYAWWVDEAGATDLSRGLGLDVEPGLLYVGEAGATRRRSGRASANTLRTRIQQMHRFGKVLTSTFRWTLAAVLFDELRLERRGKMTLAPSSEDPLTAWMDHHLSIAVYPYEDGDELEKLERAVLERLDPPFNLRHVGSTPVRQRLTEMRRRISRDT